MEELLMWAAFAVTMVLILAGKKGRLMLAGLAGKATWWLMAKSGKVLWKGLRALFRRRSKGLKPTRTERRLIERLEPEHWRKHAERRGLEGTLTGRPKLTKSGIEVPVRLDGKWTLAELRKDAERIRNLIGAPSDLRMEIKHGASGGWAKVHLRTRSAADGDDMKWSENQTSFGVDTVTGDYVLIPLGIRMLIAGASDSGKSVSARPIMWQASEGETNALVIFDLKKVEGRLWDHRARVASTPEEVLRLVKELIAEMHWRLDQMPKGKARWTPTREHPRITLVVDEGAELKSSVKKSLDDFESLARMGRAPAIDLVWMTQKPTLSEGIPPQIAGQITTRICLYVGTPGESRVVLGENATEQGWHADQLPMPGYALVRRGPKSKPNPVRVRHMTDDDVMALPKRRIWSMSTAPDSPEESGQSDPDTEAPQDPQEAVVAALREAEEPVSTKKLIGCCGLGRSQGYTLLARMVDAGRIRKTGHGRYVLSEEVA